MGTTISGDDVVRLRISDVQSETADCVSLVFDVPADHKDRFRYAAGQYLALRVTVAGVEHRRCYSMSSSPALAEPLRITVKRDPGGVVSNWINDTVVAGAEIHAEAPQGRFVLDSSDRDIVAFAGGSGITPVFSLIRTALATTGRRVRLFYANRSADSVIFAGVLRGIADEYGDRISVHHHLDSEHGVVTPTALRTFLAGVGDAEYFVCGPTLFMDAVEATLRDSKVPAAQVHLERFVAATPVDAAPAAGDEATDQVIIELDRRTTTADYRSGNTLLQTARMAGLKAPSSCETGSCGTCIAQVTEGAARMLNNNALDDDEVADGWVLTCQAMPTTKTVRIVYE
ncbi:ferredoxin--NADP reductase [Mycobacterium crocinum]|uniref:Ferredoxin--NADP reductase n=1 Tax=Mycolicibacterium crocinum TaxID=388459 RepID=A0ABY3TQC3_9MYCO|nr:ferredoxin--NADP reductase [Mycolicibacterium crocinum]MCV7219049.1 ferredoxin--NADP reductase [Mycolicibacterium crocinum]ULN43661.1 ferredoxin--NADP reductase [Mycolicibacterium crocinum]